MVGVWRSLAEVPADLGRTVVTIGNFDGVHLGHRNVLRRAREVAAELGGGPVVVVTFHPHPIAVLRPEHAPQLLTTIDQRVELLARAGADGVLVVPFDRDLALWPPERFVEEIVVERLRAQAVVVGANFRFGHKAAGDVALLSRLGDGLGFLTKGVALDGGPQVWSSTYVRSCVLAGDVEGATEALDRPFAVRGVVVEGDRRGRELGFPTANVPVGDFCVPADGVYAGWLTVLDDPSGPAASGDVGAGNVVDPMPAAISVGTNPTFDGARDRRVEAYVLDRDDLDLYGRQVEVAFTARLRGMRAFASVDDLVAAMQHDVEEARRLLGA